MAEIIDMEKIVRDAAQDDGMVHAEETARIVAENKKNIVTKNWFGQKIMVRRTINFDAMRELVGGVVQFCFDDGGEYAAYMKDPVFRYCVVAAYSNVALPDDISDAYDILYGTGLYDSVTDNVDQGQLEDIRKAVDSQIKYRVQMKLDVVQNAMLKLRDSMAAIGEAVKSIDEEELKKFVETINASQEA